MHTYTREDVKFEMEHDRGLTDIVDALAYCLTGSCASFEHGDFTHEELKELDTLIFLCDDCGWWFDIGEQCQSVHGGEVCESCSDAQFEDEEDE